MTDDSTVTPVLKTLVPSGFARGPKKSVWTIAIATREVVTPAGTILKPNEMEDWLEEVSDSASWIHMTSSKWPSMHNKYVIVPPPETQYITKARDDRDAKAQVVLTLVEA